MPGNFLPEMMNEAIGDARKEAPPRVPAGYREPAGTFRKLSDYCVLVLSDLQIIDDLLYALRVPRKLFGVRLLLR
jgi:hypothetical protein